MAIGISNVRQELEKDLQDKKVRRYTVLILTLVVVIILIVFAIRPAIESISSHFEELQQLSAQDEQLQKNLADYNEIIGVYNDNVVGAKLNILNSSLPVNPDKGTIFANINAISFTDKINLSSINFVDEGATVANGSSNSIKDKNVSVKDLPSASSAKLEITIVGNGKYSDIFAFLKDLEAYPRIFNVRSLSFATSDTNKNTDFSINSFVYYFKSPQ